MESRKLTKADLDKVRDIEGFPIGKDEDIIALSDAPYYTACPNPFVEDYIREFGTPYDEATDDYQREPFAVDVSEGKTGDVVYNAHSYHTKVPYRAIMRYILHYTKPGDVVFDGFCGTGMTGIAAQMCANPDPEFKFNVETFQKNVQWGLRRAVLNDLAVAGTHITSNYNLDINKETFAKEAEKVLSDVRAEYDWMYKTSASIQVQQSLFSDSYGVITNTLWSNIVICPHCGKDIVFYTAAVNDKGSVSDNIKCSHCGANITKKQIVKKEIPFFDELLNTTVKQAVQVPVFKVFTFNGKRYTESLNEEDYKIIDKIESINLVGLNVPTEKMLFRDGRWGDIYRSGYHKGFTHAHHFYTKRNLIAITALYNRINQCENARIRHMLIFALTATMPMLNKTNRWRPAMNSARGPINGILYIPSFYPELNVFNSFGNKIEDIKKFMGVFTGMETGVCVTTQSSDSLSNFPPDSIDYIFVDPPFGDNIMYSESNFLWESWLKVYTNQKSEAIINTTQGKKLVDYQRLIQNCFSEFFRVLKPNRWMTVEFHNSKNSVWNAIQEALLQAGFIIADVRTLNKKQGSFKQVTTNGAVKQDLVLSVYKPKDSFRKRLLEKAGSAETAWDFVRQYLSNLPVVVYSGDKIEIISERQDYLLFDRMVAYHIIQGIPVPLDATDFYHGLEEKFLKRDGMYFLHDQINEYDTARIKSDVEHIQYTFIVTNEKTAIAWLYQQLDEPQSYAELQPKFMQEVKAVDKYEEIPELSVLLEENFLQNEKGRWYIPDIKKEKDVAKLREKKLWKEFEGYLASKGKLKLFRSEAIRVGFARLWKDKNYQAIVNMAERLPERIVQEDPNILMYYDISLSRI